MTASHPDYRTPMVRAMEIKHCQLSLQLSCEDHIRPHEKAKVLGSAREKQPAGKICWLPAKGCQLLAEETLAGLILLKFTSGDLSERTHFPNATCTGCFCPCRWVWGLQQLLAWEWEKLTYHHNFMLFFIASVRQNGNYWRRDEDAIQHMNNTIWCHNVSHA